MKKTNYLFHFIISENMKWHINFLKKELGFKKDTDLYEFMLGVMSKNLPKLKEIIGDHNSEYAFIDLPDIKRIHKYARLKENNYKILKNWHSCFNEYGMSSILRDIITFFYEGVVKYGVDKFIEMISGKLDVMKIRGDVREKMKHLLSISQKKAVLFSFVVQNLLLYT